MSRRPTVHLNVSVPVRATHAAALPTAGVGLLRAEFLALSVGRNPLALLEEDGEEAFLTVFRGGLETVARAFHPRPATYRALDLKSNEYRSLEGGERFEPVEANPMLDDAVLAAIGLIIEGAHAAGVPACICGDAPSRDPGLVHALVELGIDQVSVVPDAFDETDAAIDAAVHSSAAA